MGDKELLTRLPYHAEPSVVPAFQTARLLKTGRVLAVHTKGENGVNLYPGPRHV